MNGGTEMDVREKLIKQAISHFWYGVSHDIFSEPVTTYAKLAIEALEKEKESGVTVQEWVSVKDKLPEKDGQYLIFTTQYFTPDHIDEIDHKDGIEISGYCKRYGFLSKNGIYAKYWRDIPQPPKGE